MGNRRKPGIGYLLVQMRRMVERSQDRRATALSELKASEGTDPFRILIGTILSQRTRDENTTKATNSLFARYRDAGELAEAEERMVRELIRPAGFYNMKAKSVINVARQIMGEFGGKVPQTMEELVSLPSVGRKTANCVLVYGFNIPAIPVDTHVHRISNRLGLVHTKDPEETESELTRKVPKRHWLKLNDLFVRFGQTVCLPVGPRCGSCTLRRSCRYYREVVSRSKNRV